MTITYGLDASNHQGHQSSLGGVAARFYVHKLTEGTTYIDPYAAGNLEWARNQGIKLTGGYHFIRNGNGAGQADFFIAQAQRLFGQDLAGRMWQLDCESDASYDDIKAFKQRWDDRTGGAKILFYTGDWWLQPKGWNVAALGFVGLWAAPNRGYFGRANNLRPATDWRAGYGGFDKLTVLQYDARSAIGDTNMYDGTLAQLQALLRGGGAAGGGSEETDVDIVETSLTTSGAAMKPDTVLQINWDKESTDPLHQHADTSKTRPQGYPGFIPAFNGYVDGTVYLHLAGQKPLDRVQVRGVIHNWKNGKATDTRYEVLWDVPASDGDQYVTVPWRAHAAAGQHWYIDVRVFRPEGDTDPRPDLRLVGATWRPWQHRSSK
jgi:hypothetical protein